MDQERRYFVLRRLHSLSGIFPVGAFLLEHFFTNSYSVQGAAAFNEAVTRLHALPYLQVLEVAFIGLPIVFHAVLGVVITFEGSVRVRSYSTLRNFLYVLQRLTGMFLVVFIVVHVVLTRFSGTPPERLFEHMASYLHSPFMFGFYVLGVLTASFHFSNGLWGFLVTWGVLGSATAQRRMTWVSLAVFAILSFVGINSLLGFLGRSLEFLQR